MPALCPQAATQAAGAEGVAVRACHGDTGGSCAARLAVRVESVPRLQIASQMLDGAMARTLGEMMPAGRWGARRLGERLHSSASQFDSAKFGGAVMGQGAFLVLLREASTGYVFGFYSHEEYGPKGRKWQVASREAFLFTLGNVAGPPLKLMHGGEGKVHFGGCGLNVGSGGRSALCLAGGHLWTALNNQWSVAAEAPYTQPYTFGGRLTSATLSGVAGSADRSKFTIGASEVYAIGAA